MCYNILAFKRGGDNMNNERNIRDILESIEDELAIKNLIDSLDHYGIIYTQDELKTVCKAIRNYNIAISESIIKRYNNDNECVLKKII